MSRIRSDIPIFAFTRHEATQRRVALYRGVYPVAFNLAHEANTGQVFADVCSRLIALGHVEPGDLVILTKGQLEGVSGATN
jgi:pyruvate kinase